MSELSLLRALLEITESPASGSVKSGMAWAAIKEHGNDELLGLEVKTKDGVLMFDPVDVRFVYAAR